MKHFITYTLVLFTSVLSFAQVTPENRAEYEKLLEKNTKLFDKAADRAENQDVLNRFERLKDQAQGEWLPLYYAALTRMYLKDLVTKNKELLIDQAIRDLEEAQKIENNSEILTLLGRAYIHKVELDNSNGPKYIGKIKSALNSAIKADQNNPRAFLIYGNFYANFPKFVGGDIDKARQSFKKAQTLYEAEYMTNKDAYTSQPHWGKKWNENFMAAIN